MTDALSWRNKSTFLKLSAILVLAFIFRLALLSLVHNPGLHDPLHYFNLGRRLSQGHGFTIDYVWHYSRMPSEISHGIDHWMPLAGVASAAGISLGGQSPQASEHYTLCRCGGSKNKPFCDGTHWKGFE